MRASAPPPRNTAGSRRPGRPRDSIRTRSPMMNVRNLALALVILAAASAASAQGVATGSIAGVVKDTSGAVLPGVTVEASSPVLIEKSRTAVTDGEGRYTIVDLRPGTFKMTFTLAGFTTLVRDNVEVPGNTTVPINVDLRVGALEESLTVSGQTPLVDVQNAQRTQVLERAVLDALP